MQPAAPSISWRGGVEVGNPLVPLRHRASSLAKEEGAEPSNPETGSAKGRRALPRRKGEGAAGVRHLRKGRRSAAKRLRACLKAELSRPGERGMAWK